MNFFQRRRLLKRLNYLEMTPVRKIEHKVSENNYITLLLPRFKSEIMRKLFIPRNTSEYISLMLDEIGTATWMHIDGKNKVGKICRMLEEEFGERVDPVEERMSKFLTKLYDNRYISFKELDQDQG